MNRGVLAAAAGVFILSLCLVTFARPADATARVQAAAQLPDAPGKAVVERICLGCHGADVVVLERSVPVWRETLELMKGFGAVATDDEWKTIHAYVLSNLASLHANRAPADEFAAVFLIDEAAAAGVVAYREKAGGFKTIDDLKKAPGLDAAAVEAAKNRISF
jgi:competence protein ComEA